MSGATGPVVSADSGVEASRYREAFEAFADIAAAIGGLSDPDELLHLVARRICELVGVPRCSVYRREDSSGLFRGQVGHGADATDASIKRLVCGTPADGFTREIVATRAPVVIRNARTDRRPVRAAMRDWKVVSMMGVPMVVGGDVVGLIFLDSEEQAHEFSALDEALASAFADLAAVAISQSRLFVELRTSHETVARQNAALRRVAAVDDKLTGLVLEGGDLRRVAAAVTELTRRPCAIHDAEGHQLAAAVPPELADATPPRLLDPEQRRRPEIAEALSALSPNKVEVVGPFAAAGLAHRFLVAPVTVRDDQWGTLVLSERGPRFGGFDMLIGRRTATIIALELSAARRAANAEWNARSSLASELIRGNRDTAGLQSRAQFLGMALHRPHVLCLLTAAPAAPVEFPDARAAAAAFRKVAPGLVVLATEVAEGIAAIVEVPAADSAATGVPAVKRLTAEVCASLDPAGLLRAAISAPCEGPGEYGGAYEEAREVIGCLQAFGATEVLCADDLGAARILLANTAPAEVERFALETLGAMLDEEVPGEFLGTLVGFFDNGRSVRRAATALDVHENTIRYRLGRVRELTGLDVAADSDAQLSAQLALLVLRLRGSLPQPDGG